MPYTGSIGKPEAGLPRSEISMVFAHSLAESSVNCFVFFFIGKIEGGILYCV